MLHSPVRAANRRAADSAPRISITPPRTPIRLHGARTPLRLAWPAMQPAVNARWCVARLPTRDEDISSRHFAWQECRIPELQDGEFW